MSTLRAQRRSWWWLFLLRPLLFLAISFLVARLLISLVGSVDWQQVAQALGQLSWAQAPVLLGLLVLRQGFNALPLSMFVPGLGFLRGLQNDLTANLIGTVAPPPGDVMVRVSMFRSWGIVAVDGMPGVTLNSLVFYVIRFSVPVVGVLLLLGSGISGAQIWLSVGSLVVAAVMVTGLVLLSRGDRAARRVGHRVGQLAGRFREDADPAVWAEKVSGFRSTMSTRLTRGLPASLVSLAVMVVVDGLIVLVSLRFIGVTEDLLPWSIVIGTFLVVYPLTALPLAGLGVLDAALVVAYTEVAGVAAEAEIVAALVLWRVVTILGALLMGVLTLLVWRWQTSTGRLPAATATTGRE